MTTGLTQIDIHFQENYDTIIEFCNKYNIEHDKINDVYLKMNNNACKLSGLTQTEFIRYVKTSIYNRIYDEQRVKKRRGYNVYIDDVNRDKIEKRLEEENFDNKTYLDEIQYLTKMLFKYINERKIFTDKEIFVLKNYAFTTKSYSKLEKELNISKNFCKKTMMKFRNDLRNNFVDYLKKQKK
ncbi:MAG: hypothetical protein ACOC2W_01470 [bacterium]